MLELDLFLIPFAEKHYQQLSTNEKEQFVSLLQCEDPAIYGWMMGHEAVPKDLQHIVLKVKKAKNSGL